jgi:invasion protein IalB
MLRARQTAETAQACVMSNQIVARMTKVKLSVTIR